MLVADANIWIDLAAGDLLPVALASRLDLATTDLVLHELTRGALGERIAAGGVVVHQLDGAQVLQVFTLRNKDARSSVADYSALVIAQHLGATLLTGDSHLRRAAVAAGLEVHGTLWIIESLLGAGFLGGADAAHALGQMISAGSRLPAREIEALLERCTACDA